MKEIPLTRGYVALVDDADFERVSAHKWCADVVPRSGGGECVYALRGMRVAGKKITVRLHRFLTDCPKNFVVDHADGNGLNNTRVNLRVTTRTGNQGNRRKAKIHGGKIPSSCFKGVSLSQNTGKWRAEITVGGKTLYLGLFQNEEQAAKAYDKAAYSKFGEFAQLNF